MELSKEIKHNETGSNDFDTALKSRTVISGSA